MADEDWGSLIEQEATRQGIRPAFARSIAQQESTDPTTGQLNPNARSKKGAIGLMQLMPDTAKEMGVDPMDPYQNIRGGVAYLKKLHQMYNGDEAKVARAYNAGPGNVDANFPETQTYVQRVQAGAPPVGTKVTDRLRQLRGQPPTQGPVEPPTQPSVGQRVTDLFKRIKAGGDALTKQSQQPSDTIKAPSLEQAGQYLASGQLEKDAPSIALDYGVPAVAMTLGGGVGAAAGRLSPYVPEVMSWLGRMGGTALTSAGYQKARYGEVDPYQTASDTAIAGVAPLAEGTASRVAARRLQPKAIATQEAQMAERAAQSTSAAQAQEYGAQVGKRRMAAQVPEPPEMTSIGTKTKSGITQQYVDQRKAASDIYDQVLQARGGDQVLVRVDMDGHPVYRSLEQLHNQQSELSNEAFDLAQSKNSEDRSRAYELRQQRDRVRARIQKHLGSSPEANLYQNASSMWKTAEGAAQNPAVQALLSKADDAVTQSLQSPQTLAKKTPLRTGSIQAAQSPQQIVAALRASMSPEDFTNFQRGARGRLIESSMTDGEFDPDKFLTNTRKMGGNFPALHTPAEQTQLVQAAQNIKRAIAKAGEHTAEAAATTAEIPKVKEKLENAIPNIPHPGKIPTAIAGFALGGSIAPWDILGSAQGTTSVLMKGTAALGVINALRYSPTAVKAILESPTARQMLARATGSKLSAPIWDDLATAIIQGGGHIASEQDSNEP